MVEVVVGPVVHRDTLRGQPVPLMEVEGEERADRRALVVAHVVPTDLTVVVREPVRVGARGGEQQESDVLVGVPGDEHDPRGLEELVVADHVVDPRDSTRAVGLDPLEQHAQPGPDRREQEDPDQAREARDGELELVGPDEGLVHAWRHPTCN